jgi:hypothetical protein
MGIGTLIPHFYGGIGRGVDLVLTTWSVARLNYTEEPGELGFQEREPGFRGTEGRGEGRKKKGKEEKKRKEERNSCNSDSGHRFPMPLIRRVDMRVGDGASAPTGMKLSLITYGCSFCPSARLYSNFWGCTYDRRTDRWTDGQTNRLMDGRMDGQTDRWTDGQIDGWMDGRMDGWTDGRT